MVYRVLFATTVACYVVFAHGANATTINAASCSDTDINTAIGQAVTDDTVAVPAGTCTWTVGVQIPNAKKITVQGAGIDVTTISGNAVDFSRSGSRVTGFTFTGGNPSLLSDGYGFRLDHTKVVRTDWGAAITVGAFQQNPPPVAYGLIDNNTFINGRVNVEGTWAMFGDGEWQHYLWSNDLDLGGSNAVYIEDNTFTNAAGTAICNFIDGNYGGRYVARYNRLTGCVIEAHSSQEQGNRAIRSWEIYGNIIEENPSTAQYYPYRIRGGTGVIFYNQITGTNWQNIAIALDNVRSYASAGFGGGLCDGTSPWDGNQDASGYPCRDQIGRSKDTPQWSHNTPIPAYNQAHVPAYIWMNRSSSNTELPVSVINNSAQHIQADRDFYYITASFNGTSGIGCGTLANRPATCTTGVGYWATNQSCTSVSGMVGPIPSTPIDGTLYKCTATNTWTWYFETDPYPMSVPDGETYASADGWIRMLKPRAYGVQQ